MQRDLKLIDRTVWYSVQFHIFRLWRAGLVVRSVKMSLKEFNTFRMAHPAVYEAGYIRVAYIRRCKEIRRDIGIILVTGDRWTK